MRFKRIFTPRRRKVLLLLALLVVGSVVLSGCSYPGDTPICSPTTPCAPGGGAVQAPNTGGDWYIDWLYKGIDFVIGQIANGIIGLGVGIFWDIFSQQSGTNFVTGTSLPITAANQVETVVKGAAYALVPAVLAWRIFRTYTIGTLIEEPGQSFVSIGMRVLFGTLCIAYIPELLSFAFGLSNALFVGILGNVDNLKTVASNGLSGISKLTSQTANPGILTVVLLVSVILSILWVALGLCFLLRTILIFILFCLAPLAIICGMTDEFSHWFKKWLVQIEALLIAPIPVAICIRLCTTFANTNALQNNANIGTYTDLSSYMVYLIDIIAFTAIGVVLMGKIGGQVTQAVLGAAADAIGMAAKAATRGIVGGMSGGKGGGGGADISITQTASASVGRGGGGGGSDSSSHDTPASRESRGGGAARPASESPGGAPVGGGWDSSSAQSQRETRAMHGVAAALQDVAFSSPASPASSPTGGGAVSMRSSAYAAASPTAPGGESDGGTATAIVSTNIQFRSNWQGGGGSSSGHRGRGDQIEEGAVIVVAPPRRVGGETL